MFEDIDDRTLVSCMMIKFITLVIVNLNIVVCMYIFTYNITHSDNNFFIISLQKQAEVYPLIRLQLYGYIINYTHAHAHAYYTHVHVP